MAMDGDGQTLYVANTGGESISMVDLDAGHGDRQRAVPGDSALGQQPILLRRSR